MCPEGRNCLSRCWLAMYQLPRSKFLLERWINSFVCHAVLRQMFGGDPVQDYSIRTCATSPEGHVDVVVIEFYCLKWPEGSNNPRRSFPERDIRKQGPPRKKANDEQKRRTEARRKNKEAKKAYLGGVEPSNFAFQPEWLYNGATGPVAYFLLLCSFVSCPLTPCTAFAPVDPWMWRLRNYSLVCGPVVEPYP